MNRRTRTTNYFKWKALSVEAEYGIGKFKTLPGAVHCGFRRPNVRPLRHRRRSYRYLLPADVYFLPRGSFRARFLIQIGVPTKPNAARIWFSRNRW